MVEKFEASILKSVEDKTALGASAIAVDKNANNTNPETTEALMISFFRSPGNVLYNKSFGTTGLDPGSPPMKSDSIVWMASMTKLLTAISCLQCVERGLLKLEDPISSVLEEFANPQVLTGFDKDVPEFELVAAPRAPTLRELLTHTSGLSYTAMNPHLLQWWTSLGKTPDTTFNSIKDSHSIPLLFAPGTSWAYGCGIDWAGQLVERVSNNQRLGAYMQEHIFDVLGMTHSTFHPLSKEEFKVRLVDRPMRDPASGKLMQDMSNMHPLLPGRLDDFGGSGLYSCAEVYLKVLKSFLLNDGQLLGPEMAELLFTPSLGAELREAMASQLGGPFAPALIPALPKPRELRGAKGDAVEYEFALGGNVITNSGGVRGMADKGCLYWSGLANSQWHADLSLQFIDRGRGICGVYMTELIPLGDALSQELYRQWREGIYELAGR